MVNSVTLWGSCMAAMARKHGAVALLAMVVSAPLWNYWGHAVETSVAGLGVLLLAGYVGLGGKLWPHVVACVRNRRFVQLAALVVATVALWGYSSATGVNPGYTLAQWYEIPLIVSLLTLFGVCASLLREDVHQRQIAILAWITTAIACMVVLERFLPGLSDFLHHEGAQSRLNYTGPLLLWGLPFALYQWTKNPDRAWMPLVTIFAIGISNGRIAWVALPLVLAGYAALTWKAVGMRGWATMLVASAVALVLGIGGISLAHGSSYLTERMEDLTSGSGEGRIDIWRFALAQWQEHGMWFGIGVQGFRHLDFSGTALTSSAHPHNAVVQLLLETGLVGFVAGVASVIALALAGWRNMATRPDARNVVFMCMVGIGGSAMAMTSLFHGWWMVFMLIPLVWSLAWPRA